MDYLVNGYRFITPLHKIIIVIITTTITIIIIIIKITMIITIVIIIIIIIIIKIHEMDVKIKLFSNMFSKMFSTKHLKSKFWRLITQKSASKDFIKTFSIFHSFFWQHCSNKPYSNVNSILAYFCLIKTI